MNLKCCCAYMYNIMSRYKLGMSLGMSCVSHFVDDHYTLNIKFKLDLSAFTHESTRSFKFDHTTLYFT